MSRKAFYFSVSYQMNGEVDLETFKFEYVMGELEV